MFGGGGGGQSQQMNLLLQLAQLQQAQKAQAAAAAQIASANLDTESSHVAAEGRLRRANLAQGFTDSLFGGQQTGNVGTKLLFGQ